MFEKLDIFRISQAMAVHAGQRQALIAQNVANADTPGFSARDIADFKSTYGTSDQASAQKVTRSSHINGPSNGQVPESFEVRSMASPDGNTVSLEVEMQKAAEVSSQHNRALAIYKSSLDILRNSLGRR